MNYRKLGKTGLMISEIGLGGEWLERHNTEECLAVIDNCEKNGVNILDCWMSEPNVRSNLGLALEGRREKWYIQGHIGSTWQGGQYVRTREVDKVKEAFEDMLTRFKTDYIDLGMIHYVDDKKDWDELMAGNYIEYVKELKATGKIHHIGLSTHSTEIAKLAAKCELIEMIMFSVNPAFDMIPTGDHEKQFGDDYDESLGGIDTDRAEVYKLCEENDVGITVMKAYAGGRLFDEKRSPFGTALTPIQCLHYCLTRPAVASVMVGVDTPQQMDEAAAYCTASDDEKDYASVLAKAPKHAYSGQCTYCGHCKPCPVDIDIAMVNKFYYLATMQPEVPSSLREHYKALSVNASDCIACGGCETRCPFGVKIVEKMAAAVEIFK